MKLGLFAVKELLLLKSRKQKCLTTIVAAFVFIIILNSCSNNSVTPEEDKPGRRDYEWSVDTLDSFNPLYRMWGSSRTNLWAVTRGSYYNDIYHYDGIKWSTGKYTLPDAYGIYSIFGFSLDNIFIGAQNCIYHYDGNNWNKFAELTKDGHSYDIVFNNIWGESSNDFYAFGAYPDDQRYFNMTVIAHYLNGKWKMLNTDGLFGIVGHLYKNKSDKKIYLQVIGGRNLTDSTHIYEYVNGKYNLLYSNVWTQGLQADIAMIDGEVYFAIGDEICIRNKNQFKTTVKIDNKNFYQQIWGRNSKDIFLMMTDGLAHYNGTDIEYLLNYPVRTNIFGAALFEDDIYFLIYESQTNLKLIYHGKLKKGE